MVLKVVRGKILETLELGGMSSRENSSFPRKILKTNDRNFNASGVSRQNPGNVGVTALVGDLRFGFKTVRGSTQVSPCETRSPGFAVACTLDQVVKDPCDYLWDNLYVYMLAQLIVANQGEKMSVPRGLSSELGIPRPQLPQSTVKQPKSGHLRVENRSGSMRGIGVYRQLTTVDPVSVRV